MRRVLAYVSVFGMQSQEDARRIIALGAPPERVVVTGSLKTDACRRRRRPRALARAAPPRARTRGSGSRGAPIAARKRSCSTSSCAPDALPASGPAAGSPPSRARRRGRAPDRERGPGRGPPQPAARRPRRPARSSSSTRWASWPRSTAGRGGLRGRQPGAHRRAQCARARAAGKPVLVGPHTSNFRDSAELMQEAGAGSREGRPRARARARALLEDRTSPGPWARPPARRSRDGRAR